MGDRKAFMFPGQGSQYVGMRAPLGGFSDEVNAAFELADRVLGFSLTGLIDRGPDEDLLKTSNTQPALLAMARAYSIALDSKGLMADIVMGHSLGEYAALVYAGVVEYDQALVIVRERGRLMEQAVNDSPGKMAAVIGAQRDTLEKIVAECSAAGVLEITNYNSPAQVVLSGQKAALERAVGEINSRNLGKAIELNVSAPFHSSLMKPAAEKFRKYLADFNFEKPSILFIDNVTGMPESDPEKIREKLVLQLSMPVQWEKSVLTAQSNGAASFIECGPGNVLAGLVKRIVRGVEIKTGEKLLAL
ncbi:MAG TPA: ACP S-malonyltransferase [Spirochaetota bacterium]|nr:ACP S-malonyltransferase [Spirochaetota bacterium]